MHSVEIKFIFKFISYLTNVNRERGKSELAKRVSAFLSLVILNC